MTEDPDTYLVTDLEPDPGGPKASGSVGVLINEFIILEGFRLFRTIVEAVVTELLQPNLHGLKPKPL
jgi:hypothetical protein